jgi:glycosyltransferase involved in cell wall biosynthesis
MVSLQGGPGALFLLFKPRAKLEIVSQHTYYQQIRDLPEQKWKKLFYFLEKRTYQLADRILVSTPTGGKILNQEYDIPEDKIILQPLGIDTTLFRTLPQIKKIPNSLLYVGRLDNRKGVLWLVESMKHIHSEHPGLKLYMIGEGHLSNWIQKYTAENDLHDAITLLGRLPDDALNKWYNQAQVLVVPSVMEGFGLVILEAMAAGLPVIATKVDGITSIIVHEQNGYLVDYGNTPQLSETINRVLNHDNTEIIKNASLRFKSAYDRKVSMAKLDQLYQHS